MADTKISGLTAVTTPVAGTSVLPIVQTGTTKKITITELTGTQVSAAGEVGIGGDTTGVVAGVSVTSKFCVKNEGANPVAGFVHVNDTTANSGSNTFACRSRGTLAVPTIVQNNDSLWNMYIAGNDGTDLALAAEIRVEVDGTPGSNDMPGRILLRTTPDGSQAPVDAVKIDSAQNVTVSAGNLVIGTSGKGIDFSATPGTGTSELFDDYEEGTWTPTYIDSDGALVYVASVGILTSGFYTKIGNTVICQFHIQTQSITTNGTGLLSLGGLPFTSRTLSQPFFGSGTLAIARVQDFSSNNNPSSGLVGSAATTVLLYKYSSADARTSAGTRVSAVMSTSSFDNELWGTVIYEAA
jgi:hypothetical protein